MLPAPLPEHGACAACDYGHHAPGQPGQCLLPGRPVPVATARSREGHCGPEAAHLCIGGDDLSPRTKPTAAGMVAMQRLSVHRHGQAA